MFLRAIAENWRLYVSQKPYVEFPERASGRLVEHNPASMGMPAHRVTKVVTRVVPKL